MPSPGTAAIEQAIAGTQFDVEGETTEFKEGSLIVVQLGRAIDAGWTSASPSTSTTMAATFASEFSNVAGVGLTAMNAIATGIDQEVAAWIASFNPVAGVHAYAPTAASIKSKILAASPVSSNGMTALAQAVADAFIDGFDPMVG
ncbi:MAG: hypothetical protein HWE39_12790 [Oceanospirillaceae bacterium]|nr:hypothetical protein [Oceanospirillaceae bacterium]